VQLFRFFGSRWLSSASLEDEWLFIITSIPGTGRTTVLDRVL
jgi:hypothetical protein